MKYINCVSCVCAGLTLLLLPLLPVLTTAICIPFVQDCGAHYSSMCLPYFGNCGPESKSIYTGNTSWLTMMSCTVNQVPKLPSNYSKPLYQYLFEVFARNTHLLPLGVPIPSKSEDFVSTAEYEKCLWGKNDPENNSIDDNNGTYVENDEINPETKTEESVYHQLFASRQGGYDSLTGFSLLGGKIVAALVGYIIYALAG